MKTLLSLVLPVLFLQYAQASTYYLSSSLGSDDRTPRQAQNPSTPWKSLSKLNAYFSNLQPGDAVLLKRGDVFYGFINVNKSGAYGSPIVISAYGSGNRPVVTSLVTLSGWSPNSSYKGVYESTVNNGGAAVNTVLVNGTVQQMGRYPNADAPNSGYLLLESHNGTASITDDDLPNSINWTGAELVLRSRRWVLDRDPITSQSGNTIFYTASSKYEPTDKFGYFIQNDIKTLDKPGEWYYDPSAKKLSIYLGRNDPSKFAVQASTFDNLVTSDGFGNITFNNISFKGANVTGFSIKDGSNISVTNCDILFSGKDGFKVTNHKYFDLENSNVAYSNNNAVDIGKNVNYAVVRNNIIANTSVMAGMGGSGDIKSMGIFSNGKGTRIENNQVLNTGYTAIYFNGDSTVVKNNFIDSFCLIKDDGSGIYTYSGYNNVMNKGRVVTGNIILNGLGMPDGTNSNSSAANGIYMDVGATGVEITNNTIARTTSGIFFHNAHHLVAKNNTLFDNSVNLYLQHNGNSNAVTNNTITNNIFFQKNPKHLAISILTSADDIDQLGTLDSNFYSSSVSGDIAFKQASRDNNTGKKVTKLLNLDDWKSAHSMDMSSRRSPVQFSGNGNDDNIRFEYNATSQDKTVNLGGNYRDVNNNAYSKSVVIKPFSSIILLKQTGRKFG